MPRSAILRDVLYPATKERREAITEKKIIVQTTFPQPKAIGFKGGGALGAAYIGFYLKAAKYGFLDENLKHAVGTSAGAITALALALGFSAEELLELHNTLVLENFLEGSASFAHMNSKFAKLRAFIQIYRSKKHSLSSGEVFLKAIQDLITLKFPNQPHLTFRQLAEAVKKDEANGSKQNLKYLQVVATRIGIGVGESRTFNAEMTPDIEIAKAVMASAAYPGVFDTVDLGEATYTDGGVKKNFPTRLFDRADLLDREFGHTFNLSNPCYLLVKVASKEAHRQYLHGIYKKVSLNTLSGLTSNFINTITETIDPEELRRDRLVLTLPDGDCDGVIDALQFKINEKGKIKLITGAEKATQEFLENYACSAYEVKTYNTTEEWLDDLLMPNGKDYDLNKLSDVIRDYKTLQKNDSSIQLQQFLAYLHQYLLYRNNLAEKPSLPVTHYDLPYTYPENSWHFQIIKDMKERLAGISEQLVNAENELSQRSADLIYEKSMQRIRTENKSDLQAYVECREYVNLLKEDKNNLEIKLNLNKPTQSNPKYAVFCQLITEVMDKEGFIESSTPLCGLQTVLHYIDIYDPVLNFTLKDGASEKQGAIAQLNLRNENDLKLFLLAAIYYLDAKDKMNATKFRQVFFRLFTSTPPTNMYELTSFLHLTNLELFASAYKIEKCIHFFDKAMQKYALTMSHGEEIADTKIYKSDLDIEKILPKGPDEVELSSLYANSSIPLLFKAKGHKTDEAPKWFFESASCKV